jgi:hypothetical protein
LFLVLDAALELTDQRVARVNLQSLLLTGIEAEQWETKMVVYRIIIVNNTCSISYQ